MLLFGVFCLISFATALPAPADLHTNAIELSAGEDKSEILSPIPDPPELEPLPVFLIDEVEKEPGKDAEEASGSHGSEENKEPIVPEHELDGSKPEEVVVNMQENKPPSILTNIFPFLSNLSWPSWPENFSFQPSTWNVPSFPNFFGRQIVYTNPPQPNYRYILV